jgi:c-di-GMP-binding flagellar brake protein YcgR
MPAQHETEKRDFVKVTVGIPVRYKFLSKSIQVNDADTHEGMTSNLSGMGLVMVTKLPPVDLLAPLLTHEVLIGINVFLPSTESPIKALTSVSWVECVEEGAEKCAIGLKFVDVKKEDQDKILRYVIKSQITRKVQR